MINSTMVASLVVVTAAATAALCPPLISLLKWWGRYDVACDRSSHENPTPRGGGLAVVAGATSALTAATLFVDPGWDATVWVTLAGAGVLAAIGLTDDVRDLAPLPRLLAQVAIGVGCGSVIAGLPGAVAGAVVVPAAVNMVNFMDGINGLCAGNAAVWGIGALLASAAGGGPVLAVLGAISLGGGLGFLPFNVPRARVFLGDVGSYFFGGLAGLGVLACIPAMANPSTGATVLALTCAPLLLFAIDTSVAMGRRVLAGEPLLSAHRTHAYQRLVNEGRTPHWVVSTSMVMTSLLVTLAAARNLLLGGVVGLVAATAYLASPRLRREAVDA